MSGSRPTAEPRRDSRYSLFPPSSRRREEQDKPHPSPRPRRGYLLRNAAGGLDDWDWISKVALGSSLPLRRR